MSIYRRPGRVPVELIDEPFGIVALWERTGGRPDPRCSWPDPRPSAPVPTDRGPEAALVIYAGIISIGVLLLRLAA